MTDLSALAQSAKAWPFELARKLEQRVEQQIKAGGPVTVKGKRPEGIGALGRGDGVACWAVALLEREEPR